VQARDLNFAIEILREYDGLAASSRNKRLATEARKKAPCIYEGLCNAMQAWKDGERNSNVLRSEVLKLLEASGAQVDYVEVVHAHSLASLENVEGQEAVIAVAAIFPASDGTTVRLIDNIQLVGP
jgi:pantoate--beta-alanine ligase